MGNHFIFKCLILYPLSVFPPSCFLGNIYRVGSNNFSIDMTRPRKRQAEDNHFSRIPDDLLLVILSLLDDLKFLCQCSLVSKRFGSIIYLIQTVSLTLPNTEVLPSESVDDVDNLFPNIPTFTPQQIISQIRSSSLTWLKFLVFLRNFSQLKSISLEFTCREGLCSASLFSIKVNFSNGGARVENLASVVAAAVFKDTDEDYDEDDDQVICCNSDGPSVGCCVEWLIMLSLLVKCIPLLECAVITNSKKQGKLVLRDKHLVAWRNNMYPGGFLDDLTPGESKIGWISTLHLPVSGYVLKGVYYVLAEVEKPSSNSDSGTVNDDEMIWEYVGEKKVLDEALHEMSLVIP